MGPEQLIQQLEPILYCLGDYWIHEGDTQYCCEDCDCRTSCAESRIDEDD